MGTLIPKVPKADCNHCTLYTEPFVPPVGKNSSAIHVVGEAPGKDEVRLGEPFVGMSGLLLNKALETIGVDRSKLHITNAVMCRPPENRDPTPEELACCRPRLESELKSAQRVVAMGSNALQAVMPHLGMTITRSRGHLNGKVFPTFHPAFILRHADAYLDWLRDVTKAFDLTYLPSKLPRLKQILPGTEGEAIRILKEYLKRRNPLVVDIESEGFDAWKHKLLAVAFCDDAKQAVSIHVDVMTPRVKVLLKKLLTSRKLIGHNFKFDARFLQLQLGLKLEVWFDTMLAHYLLDERTGTHELKKLAEAYFDAPPYEDEVKKYLVHKVSSSYGDIPKAVLLKYSTYDVYYTYRLYEMLSGQLEKYPKLKALYFDLLGPLSNRWIQIELHGIHVQPERLKALGKELEGRIEQMGVALAKEAKKASKGAPSLDKKGKRKEFNPLSVLQVKKLLYEDLKLPEQVKDGKLTTSENALVEIQLASPNPIVQKLLDYRHLRKLKATYVEGFLDSIKSDGQIHSSVLLHGTVTGRMAGRDPNLMNVTRATTDEGTQVRNAFVPSKGMKFIQVDFRGCELRVMTYYSHDETLRKVLNQPGSDIHTWITERCHGPNWTKDQRVWVKAIVFGKAYGRRAKSIAQQLHWSIPEAEALERKIMGYMPGVTRWQKEVLDEVLRQGYLETVFGRRRRLVLVTKDSFGEQSNQYLNFKIQSTASDLTQMSMLRVYPKIEALGGQVLMTFHDAILCEVPKAQVKPALKALSSTMLQTAYEYMGKEVLFEVEAEVGDRWGQMKSMGII